MDAGGPQGKQKSDINVTPLIDIVLVLLIVFIVMLPGLTKSVPVVVPQVNKIDQPEPPQKNDTRIVVEVMPDATSTSYVYTLQNTPLELKDISDRVAPAVQLQPLDERRVFVKVDEMVPFQVAVNVLDQVRKASKIAKDKTLENKALGGLDGGDIAVSLSLRTKPQA